MKQNYFPGLLWSIIKLFLQPPEANFSPFNRQMRKADSEVSLTETVTTQEIMHAKDLQIVLLGRRGALSFKGTLSPKTIIQYVRKAWPLITVAWFFSSRALKIKRNLHFPKNSRDSLCLRIGDRKRNVYLKTGDRKRKVVSKLGTGKEFYSQKQGPEKNCVSQNWDRKYFSGPLF